VPKAVPAAADARGLEWLDATCPLVSKVHRQAERQIEAGRHIIFIGHKGHPEVIGTFGQVPEGHMTLVETVEDVATLPFTTDDLLGFLTQTTLSVDDTHEIIEALKARYPQIHAPRAEDICYATSNRQAAVKAIAPQCDLLLVIGAPNSSNSMRLVEVSERGGTLASGATRRAIDDPMAGRRQHFGLTAGASAPETLVREVITCSPPMARRRRRVVRPRKHDLQTASWPAKRAAMAVYTHLGAEALGELICAFSVGDLVSAKGIAEGVSNSNWLIDTTGTGSGPHASS
jgi:4-hydroxy-3-methylbut-2-enyl diphosphate reductase